MIILRSFDTETKGCTVGKDLHGYARLHARPARLLDSRRIPRTLNVPYDILSRKIFNTTELRLTVYPHSQPLHSDTTVAKCALEKQASQRKVYATLLLYNIQGPKTSICTACCNAFVLLSWDVQL